MTSNGRILCRSLAAAGAILVLLASPGRAAAVAPPVVVVPALPPEASIDQTAKAAAAQLYATMMERHDNNDMAGAAEAGKGLYRLAPNPSTAFIRAWILSEAKQHCEAFESLLRASDLELKDAERAQVAERLPEAARECAPGYGWVTLEIIPGAASVSIDGAAVPVGRSVGVLAGRRSLTVKAPGYRGLEAFIRVAAGKGRDESYELVRAPAVTEKAPPVVMPEPALAEPVEAVGARDNTLPWVLIGGGGALVAAGGGLLVWALAAKSEADDYADGKQGLSYEESQTAYNSARDDAKTRSIMAYASAGLGAAAVITGIVLYSGDDAEPAGMRIAPWFGPERAGLLFSAPF
jgi:hypothetical protein